MRINSFRIRRYRAFDSDIAIPLSNLTVLVGPNNLGKSTVLRALNLFFEVPLRRRMAPRKYDRPDRYSLEDDYPKKYEGRRGRRWPTRLEAELEFSEKERNSFEELYKHKLFETMRLAIQFDVGDNGIINITRSSPQFQNQDVFFENFLRWFSENFRYVYIPATRNISDFRRSVFSEIVEGAIRSIPRSKRRVDTLEKFYSDIKSSVRQVAETLSNHLRAYLPSIQTLDFVIDELDLLSFISVSDVEINDGAKTSLSQKGDGFKSLFALSLLQFIAQKRYGANLIFGIEEPESHLHPSAIYLVKASLRELSKDFQALITTHSPILIQRDSIRDNIIVDQLPIQGFACSAKPARNLSQIRSSLGIRPQDNLTSAVVVVIVEGATEENCLAALMTYVNPELIEAVVNGQIRVHGAGGVSKIITSLQALARDAASCVVLIDSDDEGLKEKERILNSGLINKSDIFQVPIRQGCRETEFEDVFDPAIYLEVVARACGVNIEVGDFSDAQIKSGNKMTRMAKWSDVMSSLVATHGKDWQHIADDAKTAFGRAVAEKTTQIPIKSILFIKSLASQVQRHLHEQ